ncbi:MAG: YqeG family HAD IIIA-type phosphatase [Defluviitaleaceae bacterium]|nr:YqeG family HAD IIIA-type phosphatase [Defluviitaleaceae bacterium]
MLKPDFYFDSIFQIPYERLYDHGIKALIYDIDNTMAGYDEMRPPVKIITLVSNLKDIGFKVALLSNNNAKRVTSFNESMGLPMAHKANKPLTTSIKCLMGEMEVTKKETVIIGDQLFTDVWCGKNAGVTTILVKPLTEKDVLSVKLKRGLERQLLKHYLKGHTNPL